MGKMGLIWELKKENNGQRRWGMEKQCIGSQGSKGLYFLIRRRRK
jgi:hypothetical protein